MTLDKLQFWYKSSDRQPGKGKGEFISSIKNYIPLSKIKDWRKMLSDFYFSPFILDGKTWATVEHFYQASKFRDPNNIVNFDYYNSFSMESNSPWSRDPKKAWIAGQVGKPNIKGSIPIIKIDNIALPNNLTILNNFDSNKIGKKAITIALFAKFTQNDNLKNVLLHTNNAELWSFKNKGQNPEYYDHLMNIRNCIRIFSKKFNLKEISKLSPKYVSKILSDDTYILISKKEIKNYYANDKVLFNNQKAVVISRNYHPDKTISYDIKLQNNKIISFIPENKIQKFI